MKHICVHIDASPRAAVRLGLAQQLATQHEARLTALYGVLPDLVAAAWVAGEGMAAMASQLLEIDDDQRARAKKLVAEAAARSGQVAPRWVDGGAEPYWQLLQQAPYADLLVLGQEHGADTTAGALPPGLVPGALCDGGRPALVVPYAGSFTAQPRHSLVCHAHIAEDVRWWLNNSAFH